VSQSGTFKVPLLCLSAVPWRTTQDGPCAHDTRPACIRWNTLIQYRCCLPCVAHMRTTCMAAGSNHGSCTRSSLNAYASASRCCMQSQPPAHTPLHPSSHGPLSHSLRFHGLLNVIDRQLDAACMLSVSTSTWLSSYAHVRDGRSLLAGALSAELMRCRTCGRGGVTPPPRALSLPVAGAAVAADTS